MNAMQQDSVRSMGVRRAWGPSCRTCATVIDLLYLTSFFTPTPPGISQGRRRGERYCEGSSRHALPRTWIML